jgi:hypothetical protein
MSATQKYSPLTAEHFHAVDAETVRQAIAESDLEYSIDMGKCTIHHGTRYGAPIVIVEHRDQQPDELSGIWYDDGQ